MICTVVVKATLVNARKECENRNIKVVRTHAQFNGKTTLIVNSDTLTLNKWFAEVNYGKVTPEKCLLWYREGD